MFTLPAPKGLFPPEPEHYRGPKLKVAIIGAGLAGMSTAFELLDQGHEVGPIYVIVHRLLSIMSGLWIYMSQGLSLVEKWDPMLINVETTLKWDSMFSLVATVVPIGATATGFTASIVMSHLMIKARNAVALAFGPVVKALVDQMEH
ncbi:hypothetical protein GBA52_025820 [Prunus armeniaca]|nr:hypothetical protein GBA52_025820 [Prunus armeniaca]